MTNVNRKFGRLNEDGSLDYAPSPLVIDGENIWTNIPEIFLAEGYYPIEKTEKPLKEGFYYTFYWEQDGDVIVQKWEENEIPDEPDEPVGEYATDEELQAAIKEGVNSIDS